MSDCPQCAAATSMTHSGDYRASCIECCARLMRSARPNRRMASVLLAAIARLPGAPDRADILAHMKKTKEG